jgi:hypothetical protein
MRAALALAVLLGVVLAVLGQGCSSTQACCTSCPAPEPAAFQLACSSTDLKSVVATGPCATPDASLSSYIGNGAVYVQSQSAGVCHVELTFATGFTYSADVTFTMRPGGVCGGAQCKCGDYPAPTSGPFKVNNPGTTCVDAGPDGGDAASESVCPSSAIESVACAVSGRCMGCRFNAGFECTCADVGDAGAEGGGLQWQCTDTGFPCTPGSP